MEGYQIIDSNSISNFRRNLLQIGSKFSRLTIVGLAANKFGQTCYRCLCDCGNYTFAQKRHLVNGTVKSCGCWAREIGRAKLQDISGQRFGRLLTLGHIRDKNKVTLWYCKCDCGNETLVRRWDLLNGTVKSCGCWKADQNRASRKDLTGMRFGRLVVLKYSRQLNKKTLWICKCDCGTVREFRGDLLGKPTISCGCYRSERTILLNSGEGNPNWRGGHRKRDYPTSWNENLRERIRNRDNRKCQFPECSETDIGSVKKLDVHHIDGNKKNCDEFNLISMCGRHHSVVENNSPSSWIGYFRNLVSINSARTTNV